MIHGLTANDVAAAQSRFRDANPTIPTAMPIKDVGDYLQAREAINSQEAIREALAVGLKNVTLTAGQAPADASKDRYNRVLAVNPFTIGARLNRQHAYDAEKVRLALADSARVMVVDGKAVSALDYATPPTVNSDALRAADKASLLRRQDFLVVGSTEALNLATVERRMNLGGADSRWAEREQGKVEVIDVKDVPRYATQYLTVTETSKAMEASQEQRASNIKNYLSAFGIFDEADNRIYAPDRSFSMTIHVRDVVDAERLQAWSERQIAGYAVSRTKLDPAAPDFAAIDADMNARITLLSAMVNRKPVAKALSEIFLEGKDLDALLLPASNLPYVLSVKRDKAPKPAKLAA